VLDLCINARRAGAHGQATAGALGGRGHKTPPPAGAGSLQQLLRTPTRSVSVEVGGLGLVGGGAEALPHPLAWGVATKEGGAGWGEGGTGMEREFSWPLTRKGGSAASVTAPTATSPAASLHPRNAGAGNERGVLGGRAGGKPPLEMKFARSFHSQFSTSVSPSPQAGRGDAGQGAGRERGPTDSCNSVFFPPVRGSRGSRLRGAEEGREALRANIYHSDFVKSMRLGPADLDQLRQPMSCL